MPDTKPQHNDIISQSTNQKKCLAFNLTTGKREMHDRTDGVLLRYLSNQFLK
jgi:hypothetical protein